MSTMTFNHELSTAQKLWSVSCFLSPFTLLGAINWNISHQIYKKSEREKGFHKKESDRREMERTLCSCRFLCCCKAKVTWFSAFFTSMPSSCSAWLVRSSWINSRRFSFPSNICIKAKQRERLVVNTKTHVQWAVRPCVGSRMARNQAGGGTGSLFIFSLPEFFFLWDAGDWTSLKHMQGKCPANCTISPWLDYWRDLPQRQTGHCWFIIGYYILYTYIYILVIHITLLNLLLNLLLLS